MIRVFPRQTKWTPTDELAFVGPPPLLRPDEDLPVRVSCTFTWDRDIALRLRDSWAHYYSDVQVGGPAFDDAGEEFVPNRFIVSGAVMTSRGCPFSCPWCFVPAREGDIRELEIKPGFNIADNNLLACSKKHVIKVFDMLKQMDKPAMFTGGLDAKLLKPYHIDLLKSVRLETMFFACDYPEAISNLERIAPWLKDFPRKKKRCYVLVGFDGESKQEAEQRLLYVGKLGFIPMAMLYRPLNAHRRTVDRSWSKVINRWATPARAAMMSKQQTINTIDRQHRLDL